MQRSEAKANERRGRGSGGIHALLGALWRVGLATSCAAVPLPLRSLFPRWWLPCCSCAHRLLSGHEQPAVIQHWAAHVHTFSTVAQLQREGAGREQSGGRGEKRRRALESAQQIAARRTTDEAAAASEPAILATSAGRDLNPTRQHRQAQGGSATDSDRSTLIACIARLLLLVQSSSQSATLRLTVLSATRSPPPPPCALSS